MVVMILENTPPNLRGQLTRWMIEPRAGVFVGKMSAMVRDRLWEKVIRHKRTGGCIQIYPAANEQGFSIRAEGDTSRTLVDFEGLTLVARRKTL
ncbi:MAG: type I-E CRISPR-associated endoribonuclease Cas2 [Myxococcales bacterium]|nr:type I-E CRISPR-associated endoribonuclease Cas2 [Myxococcales bacterium]